MSGTNTLSAAMADGLANSAATPVLEYRAAGRAEGPGRLTITVHAVVMALVSFVVAMFVAFAVILSARPGTEWVAVVEGALVVGFWIWGAIQITRSPRWWGMGLGLWIGIGSVAALMLAWAVLSK